MPTFWIYKPFKKGAKLPSQNVSNEGTPSFQLLFGLRSLLTGKFWPSPVTRIIEKVQKLSICPRQSCF
jgi:hypothetical protein